MIYVLSCVTLYHVWLMAYDGFDRLWSVADPEGNLENYHYDANGNLLSRARYGELVEGERQESSRPASLAA